MMKVPLPRAAVSLILLALLLVADRFLGFSRAPSWKIQDACAFLEQRLRPPSPARADIALVGIDSQTIARMKERWPYSRATFAKVFSQLQQAQVKAIGLDFIFLGDADDPMEDRALRLALLKGNPVILGATVREDGQVQWSTVSDLPVARLSGLVNKLQDDDGVTREALTYLMSANPGVPKMPVFSWEMKLLAVSRGMDLSRLEDHGDLLVLRSKKGVWRIPVNPVTKTFPIHFQAHSGDFPRFSFFDILMGQFDPNQLAGKIVLIGPLTELLQDLHLTPIGWLPGLTLNANALLTLIDRHFLRPIPEALSVAVLAFGVLLATWIWAQADLPWALCWLGAEVLLFYAVSLILFLQGYTWNEALFPVAVAVIPILSKKLLPEGSLSKRMDAMEKR